MDAKHVSCELPGGIRLSQSELLTFINDTLRTKEDYRGPERRKGKRHSLILQVTAQPLDESLRPMGKPFVCISRNISTSGISLIHSERLTAPFLLLELNDQTEGRHVKAAMEVVRCEPKGRFFEIAGNFVYKIYEQE